MYYTFIYHYLFKFFDSFPWDSKQLYYNTTSMNSFFWSTTRVEFGAPLISNLHQPFNLINYHKLLFVNDLSVFSKILIGIIRQ
jgi:hypothetical protein